MKTNFSLTKKEKEIYRKVKSKIMKNKIYISDCSKTYALSRVSGLKRAGFDAYIKKGNNGYNVLLK